MKMGNPFVYPKIKHKRTQTPRVYESYKRYKSILKHEFGGQCVYCRALDNKGSEGFGVDHYRPKKHFPLLVNEYLNLYYSCNRCNSFKGSFWPNANQSKLRQFVPNPCEYIMFDHLRYQAGSVVSKSTAGDFSIELLDLNDPEAVNYREGVIGAIDQISSLIKKIKRTVEAIKKKLALATSPVETEAIFSKLVKAQNNLVELTDILRKLGGNL